MDVEEFKDIKGYEGLYQISNFGRIKSLKRDCGNQYCDIDKILSLKMDSYGYPQQVLCKNGKRKSHKIHRLVAIHFIENIENKAQINHINGIKTDNNVTNLEWTTMSENIVHAYSLRLIDRRGVKNTMSKLNESQVLEIRKMKELGASISDIKNVFNVSISVIYNIIKRKLWPHI